MFDYLDYKNKIPLEKCLIEIPRINPMSVNYERFWYHTIKRKQIEGSWVEHEGDFQWLPGTIFQYVNMWNIEMKKKTGTSKGKVIGRPRLRDLEWIKGYVHATARGFSGFINDTEISCHRILINPEMDELLEYMDDSVKATIYKSDGSLKEYKDALQYLYQYKKSNLGKPLFHNTAKNVLEIGARNYGKSVSSGNFCGHNFLTDGAMDYDEWWANKQLPKDRQEVYTTQTLIGASDSKYVNNLNKHLKIGLENLPGKMEVGKVLYPPPLSKKTSGSWVVGKDIIARYEEKIGGKWEVKGSGSGFLNRSFKDNPYAANGSRYGFGLIDEVGFMDNFEDVLGQLHECTTVDGEKYGTIWATGTGGSMENGATEPAKRVFYDPEAQEFLAFDDIFENKGKIGLFIPAWMALDEYRDKLGNINRELALKKLSKERELAKNAKSKKPLYDLLQMKPLVPSEAFLVLEGNIFPTAELKEHLATLETTERLKELGTNGWMQRDGEGKTYFKVDHSLHQTDFPTEYSIDDKGAVVIWEQPSADTPYGLYIAGIDSIDQDQAESSTSMGSIIIYKRLRNADETYHLPVAEYTGRPEFATDFYEQCRRLLEYYNAKALYENQTPGIKAYFETKNCLHLLARQPSIIKSISPNTKVDRIYGTHMTKPIKDAIEIMTRDWLKAELEPGVLQLTKIKCIPLLKELIAYNKDGNFDRVIAFMLVMMQDLELFRIVIQEKIEIIEEDNFFTRKLFI